MRLVEVLNVFPNKINDEIESIKYDGEETSYKISAVFTDDELEDEYQYIEIILFDGGETMLYITNNKESNVWLWNEVLDFYTTVKTIWENKNTKISNSVTTSIHNDGKGIKDGCISVN